MNTLRGCTNLKTIALFLCGITGEQMLAVVEATRGHCMLKELDLSQNSIGNIGCGALATLLDKPHCNIHTLGLPMNNIDNEGVTAIVNSLANNTKLQKL